VSTVTVSGRSLEDAIAKAAERLSIDESEVQYKIVSRTGGILGLLGQQVVTIEVTLGERAGESPAAEQPEPEPEPEPQSEPEPAVAAPQVPPPLPSEEDRGGEAPVRDDRPRKPVPEERVIDEEVLTSKMEQARVVVGDLVGIMGGEAELQVLRKGGEIHVAIIGSLPDWVGRGHSRAVESLQFVVNKIVNRFPPRYRVVLMPEGKRDPRLKELEAAALGLSATVKETGKSVWMVPMTAKERRIVHLAVSAVPELTSVSVGDGNHRRVCISLENRGDAPE